MRFHRILFVIATWFLPQLAMAADAGNRLAYLDEYCNPFYVGLDAPKLVTPQWIGEPGVEAVFVLSIDDMGEPERYEGFLRPILERLKKIDGRAPLSIMCKGIDPNHPQVAPWFKEGVSIETHTTLHPCPCLQGSNFEKAKGTFDQCIDQLAHLQQRPVAFRMPCCDSMNSTSPRFFVEMFNRTTAAGNFLQVDSSVFVLLTPDDPALPRPLVLEESGRPRFDKYVPRDRRFVNFICDYPYPYVIDRRCWEVPGAIPDDWQGHNRQGPHHPDTVRDMKAAIDAAVSKQGVFTLTFHPGAWIRNDQVIELIDHTLSRHGGKVKFLNLREVLERLTANLLGGQPLRAADGSDNGVRVLDVNRDGFMDVVLGNDQLRQTRLWSPTTRTWTTTEFPASLVSAKSDTGVRFGVLRPAGAASILVHTDKTSGVWHFEGDKWVADAQGLAGLQAEGPVYTSVAGRDRGVRLLDLDGDGRCELIVGNPQQSAVFRWQAAGGGWERLPFKLPDGARIVDDQGRDAGLRFVDLDENSRPDVVFSDAERFAVHRFVSLRSGWSPPLIAGRHGDATDVPPVVRADGTNNGVWFKDSYLWVQSEDTGGRLPHQIDSRSFANLLGRTAAGKWLRLIFITCSVEGKFFEPVKKGMADAAALMGVAVEFTGTTGVDFKAQAEMVRRAVKDGYDGIALNLVHTEAFDEVVQEAITAGVPVVAFNTDDHATPNARLSTVNQRLYEAGRALAKRVSADIPAGSHVLMTMHDAGISSLEDRLRGEQDVLREKHIRWTVTITGNDSAKGAELVAQTLRENPDIRVVLGTGQSDTEAAGLAIEKHFADRGYWSAGFDLSANTLRLIKQGTIRGTVDQQPYIQGFYPVIQLTLYARYGIMPSSIDAGATIIDRTNVDRVIELTKQKYR